LKSGKLLEAWIELAHEFSFCYGLTENPITPDVIFAAPSGRPDHARVWASELAKIWQVPIGEGLGTQRLHTQKRLGREARLNLEMSFVGTKPRSETNVVFADDVLHVV